MSPSTHPKDSLDGSPSTTSPSGTPKDGLDRLPPELILELCKTISSRSDLDQVCRLSKKYHEIASPFYFETISFSLSTQSYITLSQHLYISQLVKCLDYNATTLGDCFSSKKNWAHHLIDKDFPAPRIRWPGSRASKEERSQYRIEQDHF